MDIINRKEAKSKGLKKYFTGKPCIKGHVCEKRVSNHECIECSKIRVTSSKFKSNRKLYNALPENKVKNKKRVDRYLNNHSSIELKNKNKEYSNNYASYDKYNSQLTIEESPRDCKGRLEVKCANCRGYFKPKQMHVNKRVQCLKGNCKGESRLYCSEGCKFKCSIYNKQSIANHNKHKNNRPQQSVWAKYIKERDDNICQICGVSEEVMYAHHIESVLCNPIESLDIDNGITLCKKHHTQVHKLPGCDMNKVKVFSLKGKGIN